MKHFISLFLLMLALTTSSQTIINAERVGGKDSTVFACSINYQGTRGNASTNQLHLSPVVLLKGSKQELKLFGAYHVLASSAGNLLNSAYVHARHHFALNSRVKTLAFYQLQFNEILQLNKREVFGSGFRFEAVRSDSLSLALSAGVMHEYELLDLANLRTNEKHKTNYFRASLISSFKWISNRNFQIDDVIYYQPHLVNFKDFRVLNDLSFSFKLNHRIRFLLLTSIRMDSQPPSSIKGIDWNFKFGIEIKR